MNTKNTITISQLTKGAVAKGPVRVRVQGHLTPRVFVITQAEAKFYVTEVRGIETSHCETIRDVQGFLRCFRK